MKDFEMEALTWIIGQNQRKHRHPYGKETGSQRRTCVKTEAKLREKEKEREDKREGGKFEDSMLLGKWRRRP